jgi:hypothetical protein
MLGLTSRDILRYRYLSARSEERWVSFLFVFFIYTIFFIPENLTNMCLLCADVGLVRPTDYARNMRHPRPEAAGGPTTTAGELLASEAERVLRQVEGNFTSLTRTVPMAEIEDLPPSMQPHIVGEPRMWVHLFRHLENVVDHYNRAHRPRP